jgi:predicted permease
MVDAFQIVLALLIMMVVGYALSAKGYISDKVATFLSKLVVWVGVPSVALDNMLSSFRREMLRSAGLGLVIPFVIVGISYLFAMGLARLLKVKKGRRGVFYVMCACSNTIFIGLPVSQALFGSAAVPYVLLYDIGHALIFWTVGAYFMQKDKQDRGLSGEKAKISLSSVLRKLLSPGLVSMLVAILILLLDIPMPLFFLKTVKYFGGLCTPLALIFIGHIIRKNGLRNLRIQKDTWGVIAARFLAVPLIALGLVSFIGMPGDMSKVFIAEAAMPVMSSTVIVAAEYGSDSDFASEAMAVTTLLSFAVIPFLALAFSALF